MISVASSWAISGIHHNMQRFNDAADRITDPDTVTDVSDILQMKSAEHGVKVNVSVLKVANEMSENLVDLFT